MIEEPPILNIKKTLRRPSASQLAAFADVPASVVSDARPGKVLDSAIAPLAGGPTRIVGPAITADNGPGDMLATFAALPLLEPGDVLMSAVAGHTGCAVIGDRVAGMLTNAGAAGFVTDGLVRDRAGIVETGLPVFCRGLSPASPYSNGPGWVGFPMQLGGQQIATGDIVVGDEDGVVVIPFDEIDAVIEMVSHILNLEAAFDKEVRAGRKTFGPVDEIMKGPRTRYID